MKGLLIALQYHHKAAEGRLGAATTVTVTRRGEACCCPASSPLAAFAILIGLGIWQLERKAWKEDLIATLAERMSAPPSPLPPRGAMAKPRRPPPMNSAASRMRAQFDPEREARVYSGGAGLRDDVKAPGYFAFAPARLADGSTVVVNRGHVDNPNPDASLKPIAVPESAVDVVGALRWPEPPGWFVTPYSERQDLWFVRDHRAMAARYGWGEVAPFYIELESPGAAGRRAAAGPAHGQAAQRPPRLCADLVRACACCVLGLACPLRAVLGVRSRERAPTGTLSASGRVPASASRRRSS